MENNILCAHCIAVAEDNNELKQFLTWFASSKGKECNLTNAVYHGTYKHAGLKKPPNRKYGDVTHIPIDHKTDRLPLSDFSNVQLQSNSHSSIQCSPSVNIDKTLPPTTTSNSATQHCQNVISRGVRSATGQNQVSVDRMGAMQPLQFCSTAQNVGTINVSTNTSQPLMPSLSATVTTPLVSLLSSVMPHITLPSPAQSHTPNSLCTSRPKPATAMSGQPFFITALNNRIKKCSGCNMLFRECSPTSASENTYILGHLERDWFPHNGQWQLGKLQNKYYHIKRSCILQRCSLYRFPQDLSSLSSKLDSYIPTAIKDIVLKEFGVKF